MVATRQGLDHGSRCVVVRHRLHRLGEAADFRNEITTEYLGVHEDHLWCPHLREIVQVLIEPS
jgi:hypothetical protein